MTTTVATVVGPAAVTVSDAAPDFPSLVAVILAVPGLTAVTSPVPFTVATGALLDVHVTTRPVSTVPLASVVVAVACVVARTGSVDAPSVAETNAVAAGTAPTGSVPPPHALARTQGATASQY